MKFKENKYFLPELAIAFGIYNQTSAFVKDMIYDNYVIYQSDEMFNYFETWLYAHYKNTKGNTEAYIGESSSLESNSQKNFKPVKYRKTEGSFSIQYHGKKITISKERQKLDNIQSSIGSLFFNQYNLSGIQAKAQIQELINEAVQYGFKLKNKSTLGVYTNYSDGYWNKNSDLRQRTMESVILPTDVKDKILNDAIDFDSSKEWYYERSIPYTRTYLFTGDPGNGKTSLAIALASELGKNIYSLDLASLSGDNSLRTAFTSVPYDAILLIEDIDSVLDGRKILTNKDLTFTGLINALNGVSLKEGLVTIITTNHPEKLDRALTRKGRIDKTFLINNPSIIEVVKYVNRFFPDHEMIPDYVEYYKDNLSMSDIQDICVSNKDDIKQAIREIIAVSNDKHRKHEGISART